METTHKDCNCKEQSDTATVDLSPKNRRVLQLLKDNGPALTQAVEQALINLGIRPIDGGQFFLAKLSFGLENPHSSGSIGAFVGACCPDGTYAHCSTPGCDPCEGHY